jgi:hypothetical protein
LILRKIRRYVKSPVPMAVLKHTQSNNSRCVNVFGGYTHASAF